MINEKKERLLKLWKMRQEQEGFDVSGVNTLEEAEHFFDKPTKKVDKKKPTKKVEEPVIEDIEVTDEEVQTVANAIVEGPVIEEEVKEIVEEVVVDGK